MSLFQEGRPSDSPYIETVWRAHSVSAGAFTSRAACHCEIVLMRHAGKVNLTIRGPETLASQADYPADADWFGITLKLGAYLPPFPPGSLRDRRDVILPHAAGQSFWLNGSAWQYPEAEDAETFVARLARHQLLVVDPLVQAALQGHLKEDSLRSVQRHFLRATGLTAHTVRQIERARYALSLLEQNIPILDTVDQAGYFDQPHLTRAFKRLIGTTPAQITRLHQSA
jgi:AraC-like DNA-binding protein